jgi:hypothetical protein
MQSKLAKMIPNYLSSQNFIKEYKYDDEFDANSKFNDTGSKKCSEKSYWHKKENIAKSEKTQNSHSFCSITFFRIIFGPTVFQRIWNQHKNLHYFKTHNNFEEKRGF